MHDTVQVELSGSQDDVLSRLFYLCGQQGVRFVDFSQTVQHFWQFRRRDGLDSNLQHRLREVLDGSEDVEVVVDLFRDNGRRLGDGSIDPTEQYQVTG